MNASSTFVCCSFRNLEPFIFIKQTFDKCRHPSFVWFRHFSLTWPKCVHFEAIEYTVPSVDIPFLIRGGAALNPPSQVTYTLLRSTKENATLIQPRRISIWFLPVCVYLSIYLLSKKSINCRVICSAPDFGFSQTPASVWLLTQKQLNCYMFDKS